MVILLLRIVHLFVSFFFFDKTSSEGEEFPHCIIEETELIQFRKRNPTQTPYIARFVSFSFERGCLYLSKRFKKSLQCAATRPHFHLLAWHMAEFCFVLLAGVFASCFFSQLRRVCAHGSHNHFKLHHRIEIQWITFIL